MTVRGGPAPRGWEPGEEEGPHVYLGTIAERGAAAGGLGRCSVSVGGSWGGGTSAALVGRFKLIKLMVENVELNRSID